MHYITNKAQYIAKMAKFSLKMFEFDTTKEHVDTLLAYLREFSDSSRLADDGLMQQIINVLALPPRESCNAKKHQYSLT